MIQIPIIPFIVIVLALLLVEVLPKRMFAARTRSVVGLIFFGFYALPILAAIVTYEMGLETIAGFLGASVFLVELPAIVASSTKGILSTLAWIYVVCMTIVILFAGYVAMADPTLWASL